MGWSYNSSGVADAFIWRGAGTMQRLENFLSAGDQTAWNLEVATGINDDGTVCGYGTYTGSVRGFAIKPKP